MQQAHAQQGTDVSGMNVGMRVNDAVVCISYLGVDYEYRRQGIGRHLVDYVQQIAEQLK